MSSMRWTGAARASLIVLSFLVHAVHSFIPASPSNSTDATANLLNATLNGALVHYTDDAPSGTTTTPWVALVACDQNAPDATPDDIFARAKNSGAQAGVLYSLFSSTCIVNPGYSNPPLDVYVSTSLVSSKLLENVFRNVDAAKFGTFNPASLDSESANVSLALSDGFNVDPGYTVAVIAARVPIFSSVYTALPTATGSNNARTSGTATSLAPNSTATSPSGNVTNENAVVFSGLPMLTLAGCLLITLSLTVLA